MDIGKYTVRLTRKGIDGELRFPLLPYKRFYWTPDPQDVLWEVQWLGFQVFWCASVDTVRVSG